jgi:outer membrane protein assembly factor BamB
VRHVTADRIFVSALSGDTAYVWAVASRGGAELRAYAMLDGSLQWAQQLSECAAPAIATSRGVFCPNGSAVAFFRSGDGHVRAVSTKAALVALDHRVLLLHDDKRLESFDENGIAVGSVTLPVMPARGFMASGLQVAGKLACGVERNDGRATVFCVDASPRVVWSKTLSVAEAALTQVDEDVVVVSSSMFATSTSSEVLRTTDGASLLHVDMRVAAASSTGHVLEGVFTAEPLAFYDKTGTMTWTAAPDLRADALRVRRVGERFVIALYSPISTGTRLVAVDASAGTLLWRGNVESLPIAHSEYANEVELRVAAGTALLLGHESSQELAEWFDTATGKRLTSIVRGI